MGWAGGVPAHRALSLRLNSAVLPLPRGGRHSRALSRLHMRAPGDDEKPIDVEVAKDELRKASASKRVESVFDVEGLQAGYRFSQSFDEQMKQQRAQAEFNKAFQAQPQQGGIPWGTLVVVGLGGLVLTGKLNVFTLIGEAVSGFVFVTVGLPLLLIGGVVLFLKTQFIQSTCPVCASEVTVAKSQATPCLNCGTVLVVENGAAARAGDFNTQVDAETGRQSVVKDVFDVDAQVVDDKDSRQ
eukprot:Tamp_22113.p1 GENE.Tamp_22113~~Tamp_22113.p1  ORF type:complete len:263 (-),score=48.26 Tamp_22113:319-1044(-)